MRPVHSDLTSINLEIIQISHCVGGGVCVLEVGKAKTLGFACVGVCHKSELDHGASIAEDLDDVLFAEV